MSVTCTLSNATGLQTNINGLFTGISEPITTFECVNLPVASGLNVFTVTATDMAGNATTTNINYVLDYASDTNPPSLQITWPLDGAEISTADFTLRGQVDDEITTVVAEIVSAAGQTNTLQGLVERNRTLWVQGVSLAAGTNLLILTATDASGNVSVTNLNLIKSDVVLTMNPVAEQQLNELFVTVSGTINTNGYKVWVNGVAASDVTNGLWQANEVPMTPGGTAVFSLTAIPLTDNNGNGSGAGSSSDPSLNNPTSTNRVPTAGPEQDKLPVVKLAEGRWSVYDEEFSLLEGGLYSWDYQWRWNETNGGFAERIHTEQVWNSEVTSGLRAWMDTRWQVRYEHWLDVPTNILSTNAVNLQDWFWQGFSFSGPLAKGFFGYTDYYGEGGYMFERTAKTRVVLRTGGKASVTLTNVFVASATATELTRTTNRPIAVTQITIPTFGNVRANGYVCALLPDNAEYDITPVAPASYYNYGVRVSKHAFKSQCVSPTPTNRARLNLGVGEQVGLLFAPTLPFGVVWYANGGSVNPTAPTVGGSTATFTARSNAGSASVTASLPGLAPSISFSVVEPTNINATLRGQPDSFNPLPVVGAGMQMDVVLQPINVSFYKVEMMEPGAAATGTTGYFINNAPSHNTGNGANAWHPVNYGNLVVSGVFDHASSVSLAWPVPQGGSYTWPIAPVWRAGAGDTTTSPLNGWTPQVHTMSADGTMTVQKLGHTIIRHPNEQYGTAQ